LVILEPTDGASSPDRVIAVRGLAQPNVIVVREVPLWFDQTAPADGEGRWSMLVELAVGQNTMSFRVGDDPATRVTLTVYYNPS
jgi:hypothetical protein